MRGEPQHLRADNDLELITWALRDYCHLTGTRTAYIEPGLHGRILSLSPSKAGSVTSC
jgi:hypothetical protein